MSIVRIGLSETQRFAEGWDAIFGKKKAATKKGKASASKKAKGRASKKKSKKK